MALFFTGAVRHLKRANYSINRSACLYFEEPNFPGHCHAMWAWFARRYDEFLAQGETETFGPWRRKLLGQSTGGVCLEIGAGTGSIGGMWPGGVSRLVIMEPSNIMREQLISKMTAATAAGAPIFSVHPEILPGALAGANSIPFPDKTFDVVLSSLVLCGVPGSSSPVLEIRRVLKPGGTLYFIEHVAHDRWLPWLFSILISPIWWAVCRCSRVKNTETSIEAVFDEVVFETMSTFSMKFVYGKAIAH